MANFGRLTRRPESAVLRALHAPRRNVQVGPEAQYQPSIHGSGSGRVRQLGRVQKCKKKFPSASKMFLLAFGKALVWLVACWRYCWRLADTSGLGPLGSGAALEWNFRVVELVISWSTSGMAGCWVE